MTTTAAQQVALENALCLEISSRYALNFRVKKLMHFPQMKKLSPSSRNLDTKETLNLSLKWFLIKCTNHEEPLLQSSTSVYLGKLQMWDSPAYKTYLAFATSATSPKKAKKFKKPTSPLRKRTLVIGEEEEPEPAKKVVPSNNSKPGVPDEPKGKSVNTNEGTGLKLGVLDLSKADSFESEYESWDDSGDEAMYRKTTKEDEESDDAFLHTLEDYVPINDEMNNKSNNVDKEEYERISEELYGDVNTRLTYVEPINEEKGNKDMTNPETVNDEHKEGSQEVTGDQVKDDAQETVTAALDAQKIEVLLQSSFISSDYATKFLNFDNIPSGETKIISIMDVKVQHEDPSIQTSLILSISISIIPKSLTGPTWKKKSKSSRMLITLQHFYQQSNLKSKCVNEYLGTSLDDALYKVLQKHSVDIIKEHFIPAEIIKRLRQQYVPQKSTDDIRKIKIEHVSKQQVPKSSITSSDTAALDEFDQKTTLCYGKGVAEELKKRKLDYADKDEGPSVVSDQGLKRQRTSKGTETSKKTSTKKDSSKGKSLATSSKSSKSGKSAKDQVVEPISVQDSDNGEHDDAKLGYADMPMDQGEDLGNTNEQPNNEVVPKNDWYKKSGSDTSPDHEWNEGKLVDDRPEQSWLNDMAKAIKPPLTFDELMHTLIDFSSFAMDRLKIKNLTKELLVGSVYNLLKGTCKSYVELGYTMEECYRALSEQINWNNPEADFFFNNDLEYLIGGNNDKKYTASTTKSKAARYELKGIEDMVPNLWSLVKVFYDRYAFLEISHRRTKRQNFYGYTTKMVSKHDVYSTKMILSIINVKVNEWHGYGYLEEIVVKRAYQQLYTFKEGDFKRLYLNDIEDMLLLFVQNKLNNLDGNVVVHLAVSLCMFARRTTIQARVEDLQLGVKSCQKKINLTKPRT
ncbi:hypothetical protein Tco_0818636 [Tanacetum coccineum]